MKNIGKIFFILFLIFPLICLASCDNTEQNDTSNPGVDDIIKTYNVTIDGDLHKVIEGEKAPLLQPEDTLDKIFSHWEVDGVKFDINTAIYQDTEIKSVFRNRENYKVYFDDEEVMVKEGFKVEKPDTPTKEGYTFYAWFDENNPFDFETIITKDIYLTSKWVKDEVDIGNNEYIFLDNIGGINTPIWDSYYYRNNECIYFKFETDQIVEGHYAIGLYLQLGDAEKSSRNENTFLIQAFVSERISIYHYPNNSKKEIIKGELNLLIGIKNKIIRDGDKTVMTIEIPYDALRFLIVDGEFDNTDVIGLSMTADQMINVVSDSWETELKGFNNKNLVDRGDPRDYIRISYDNVLFNFNNNSVDTFISGNVGQSNVLINVGDYQTISDKNGDFSLQILRNYNDNNLKVSLSKDLYENLELDIPFEKMTNEYIINTKLQPLTGKLNCVWTNEVNFDNNYEDLMIKSISLTLGNEEIEHGLAFKVLVKKTLVNNGQVGLILSDCLNNLNITDALLEAINQEEFVEIVLNNQIYLETEICLYNYPFENNEQLFVKAYLKNQNLIYSNTIDFVISDIAQKIYLDESLDEDENTALESKYLIFTLQYDEYTKDIRYGELLSPIEVEPKLYQKLLGWYNEDGVKWNFDTDIVKGNVILHSEYEADYSNIEFVSIGQIGGQLATKWDTYIAFENNYIITKIVTDEVIDINVSDGVGFLFHFGDLDITRTAKTYIVESYVLNSDVSGSCYHYPNNSKKEIKLKNSVKNLTIENGMTTMYMLIPLESLSTTPVDELKICVISVTGNNTDVWTFDNQVVSRETPLKYVILKEDGSLERFAVSKEVFDYLASKTTAYKDGKTIFDNLAQITTSGTVEKVENNANLFSNRLTQNYIFDSNTLEFLDELDYTFNKIEGGNFVIQKSGYVILMVPDNSSYQTLNNKISSEGWVKVLSKFNKTGELTDDISYYIKWCEAGESYSYGKWNIAITKNLNN